MEEDERFKHLATDPRFKTLRRKQKKVEIDERFQSVFTDEKFTLKYSKDKRGRSQKKSTGDDLRRYYSLPEDDESKIDGKRKPEKPARGPTNDHDADQSKRGESASTFNAQIKEIEGEDVETQERDDEKSSLSSQASDSDISSSSDESESEVELDSTSDTEPGIAAEKIEYDWKPLDHDAETADLISKRLAIQNLDWDHLDVRDIYTLVNSIMPPLSVRIYVSEFGKERMKREAIEGPQEIAEMPQVDEEEEEYNQLKSKMDLLKNREPKTIRVNEYEDADEQLDPKNEEIRERIRRYQLNRMKYYYAVVEFDSPESAEIVYKELDGTEYEGSSLELDLRFIPDNLEFEQSDMIAECNKMPDLSTYKAPQFISSALQQTTVKFTWDETDIKRQDKLRKAFTKEELEKDDLEVYLASESDSDDEQSDNARDNDDSVSVVTANSEARANKYRQLLKSLEEEEERKKKTEVDVEWGNYDEDEEKVDRGVDSGSDQSSTSFSDEENEEEPNDSDDSSEEHAHALRQNQSRKTVKVSEKVVQNGKRVDRKPKKSRRKKGADDEDSEHGQESGQDDELDLLVMDAKSEREEFKFNPDDERFKAVYESGLYNVDPSHPNFKRTEAFDMIAERKRSKRLRTRA